jgi:hypothetical protein
MPAARNTGLAATRATRASSSRSSRVAPPTRAYRASSAARWRLSPLRSSAAVAPSPCAAAWSRTADAACTNASGNPAPRSSGRTAATAAAALLSTPRSSSTERPELRSRPPPPPSPPPDPAATVKGSAYACAPRTPRRTSVTPEPHPRRACPRAPTRAGCCARRATKRQAPYPWKDGVGSPHVTEHFQLLLQLAFLHVARASVTGGRKIQPTHAARIEGVFGREGGG